MNKIIGRLKLVRLNVMSQHTYCMAHVTSGMQVKCQVYTREFIKCRAEVRQDGDRLRGIFLN